MVEIRQKFYGPPPRSTPTPEKWWTRRPLPPTREALPPSRPPSPARLPARPLAATCFRLRAQVASKLLKSEPSIVVYGDTTSVPRYDVIARQFS